MIRLWQTEHRRRGHKWIQMQNKWNGNDSNKSKTNQNSANFAVNSNEEEVEWRRVIVSVFKVTMTVRACRWYFTVATEIQSIARDVFNPLKLCKTINMTELLCHNKDQRINATQPVRPTWPIFYRAHHCTVYGTYLTDSCWKLMK